MNRPRKFALHRILGLAGLAVMAAAPGFAQGASGPSVMVFPLEKPEAVDASVADTLAAGLTARISATHVYDATTFNAKSPLMVRAIQSNAVTQSQATAPFTTENGAAVAKAAGADFAVIGSVEDATADEAAGTAKVTATVQMLNAETGKIVKTAGVSGDATSKGLAADALLRMAADNAAAKVASQFFPATTPGTVRPSTPIALPTGSLPMARKKKSNTGLILGGLALVGIIIAASGGGGGSTPPGGGGPPPLPL